MFEGKDRILNLVEGTTGWEGTWLSQEWLHKAVVAQLVNEKQRGHKRTKSCLEMMIQIFNASYLQSCFSKSVVNIVC